MTRRRRRRAPTPMWRSPSARATCWRRSASSCRRGRRGDRRMRSPPRILIADDNSANLDILRTRLASHGYEIVTAMDGDAALEGARQHQPDLILLDVMMPKRDGFEVCRQLKVDPNLPFMPIILVTAKCDSRDIVAGLECGGDEYLTKPVDHAALMARVKSILRIKALHDTVQEQAARLQAQTE